MAGTTVSEPAPGMSSRSPRSTPANAAPGHASRTSGSSGAGATTVRRSLRAATSRSEYGSR